MEILYSKTILAFLKKVKRFAVDILSIEMKLEVGRTRFYIGTTSYPLRFVVFDHPSKLGYFIPTLYEIGINKLFLLEKEEEIKDLLRHEIAHYLAFIKYGNRISPHGKEFRNICKHYGWRSEISKAQVSIEKAVKNKRIVNKVRKLLSLGKSPNPEEAKLATLKARELLCKYHLDITDIDDETVIIRVLEKKRRSAKMQAIADILRHFFVYPIFNYGRGAVYLEVIGDRINVEIAEYIAHFLDTQFEILWEEGKKKSPVLKGAASKNSFFRGLAKGYQKQQVFNEKGLIRIEKTLIERVQTIYPHLSTSKRSFLNSEKATQVGEMFGKHLKIHEGIKKNNTLFLS